MGYIKIGLNDHLGITAIKVLVFPPPPNVCFEYLLVILDKGDISVNKNALMGLTFW